MRYRWLGQGLLLLVPLVASIFVVWKFGLMVNAPFRFDYAEGFVLHNAIMAAHGQPIYQATTHAPYVFGFYTPVYFYLLGLGVALFGAAIWVGRVLTFVSFILVCLGVGWIVWGQRRSRFLAVLAGSILLGSYVVSMWGVVIRPDMLGLLLVVVALSMCLQIELSNRWRIIWVAGLLALAFFTKQNLVLAPVAVAIWLWFKDKRQAWLFVAWYGGLVAAGVGLASLLTGGHFFTQVFVYSGRVDYHNLYPALRTAVIFLASGLPLVVAAGWAVWRRPKELLSIYSVVALLGLAMLVREGGTLNYALELSVALVARALTSDWWDWLFAREWVGYGVAALVGGWMMLWCYSLLPWQLQVYVEAQNQFFAKERQMVVASRTPVLAEDALMLLDTNKSVELEPFTYGQAVKAGFIDSSELFSAMAVGKYHVVVDEGALGLIPGFDDTLQRYYQPIYTAQSPVPLKRYDYGLYNRHSYQFFGQVWVYRGGD